MKTDLHRAFHDQARHCEALGSPFMGRLLNLLADRWPEDTALAQKLAAWEGDIGPLAASLPLRTAGGLHALVLQGMDEELAAVYPPNFSTDIKLWHAVEAALFRHDAWLCEWIENAPQTNEVRRAAALIASAHLLTARYDLPMHISELGASGGLNLMFDQFALKLPDQSFGPYDSTVTLTPDWSGQQPRPSQLRINERRGVDLNPLDAKSPEGALRLIAYLWPDQTDRLSRTRAAIALQNAPVDRGDAIAWLESHLQTPFEGLHLIYHTIAWQYFPADAQARGKALIEAAGTRATPERPLAWLRMEADGKGPGAGLSLRIWPGNHEVDLGRIDFHGRWVDWKGPARLP